MPKGEDLLQKIQDLQTEIDSLKPKVVYQVIFWHTEYYLLQIFFGVSICALIST